MKESEAAVHCHFLLGEYSSDVFDTAVTTDMHKAQLTAAFRLYYRLRSFIPLPLRQLLQRYRPVQAGDAWYIPQAFTDALCSNLHGDGVTTIHPWPDGAKIAFVLTHDVETADGMR